MTRRAVLTLPAGIAVQAMQKYGKVIFVTNGALAPADRVWVRQSGAGCIERENTGFDVGAYREALLTIGREALAEYEEIILMNYTLAGPVCELQPMFEAMQATPGAGLLGPDPPLCNEKPAVRRECAGAYPVPFPRAAAPAFH